MLDVDACSSIVVLGDLMLDVFQHGEATRLSPEAPVVILSNPKAEYALGGSGNTASNALALGHPTVVVGAVGTDTDGFRCVQLVDELGLGNRVVRTPQLSTTVKSRFLANGHQIMRLDVEQTVVPPTCHEAFLRVINEELVAGSVLVLSDYDKGAVTASTATRAINLARERNIPIVVDSKKADVSCFAGCTVIAPNHHEAERMTGMKDPASAARSISERTGGAVLVTLGPQGMLILDDGSIELIPSYVQDVADVTGAGDTVTAALAVALAEGATVREAAHWANRAAAEAVSHAGTYAVPRDQVPDQIIA